MIDAYIDDRLRKTERTVQRIESSDTTLKVTFESALVEPFDIVVSNTFRKSPSQLTPEESVLHIWEFDWPSTLPNPPSSIEVWTKSRALLTIPYQNGIRVRLLSTTGPSGVASATSESLANRFASLFESIDASADALSMAPIQYHKQSIENGLVAPETGKAVVGIGLPPRYSGDSLATTERIEESWILADALAYGHDGIEEAISEFEQRRRDRHRNRCNVCNTEYSSPSGDTELQTPLETIFTRRGVVFNHLLTDGQSSISLDISDRL